MSRLDTKALRSVILVLDSGLSLTEEEMFILLEGYGEGRRNYLGLHMCSQMVWIWIRQGSL